MEQTTVSNCTHTVKVAVPGGSANPTPAGGGLGQGLSVSLSRPLPRSALKRPLPSPSPLDGGGGTGRGREATPGGVVWLRRAALRFSAAVVWAGGSGVGAEAGQGLLRRIVEEVAGAGEGHGRMGVVALWGWVPCVVKTLVCVARFPYSGCIK